MTAAKSSRVSVLPCSAAAPLTFSSWFTVPEAFLPAEAAKAYLPGACPLKAESVIAVRPPRSVLAGRVVDVVVRELVHLYRASLFPNLGSRNRSISHSARCSQTHSCMRSEHTQLQGTWRWGAMNALQHHMLHIAVHTVHACKLRFDTAHHSQHARCAEIAQSFMKGLSPVNT